ncbi:DUF1648 domain-containing protein [Microbacterium sp. Se63.02b]|uniref:DUF1648 domain-containing protein n=1 Tax=Microbacterium sp. Se63.02b TaxID=2709304 RepID=UPI001FCEC502|nr:DUF1648 domain-containing protein [Microbacterium sp. Se63.02b]
MTTHDLTRTPPRLLRRARLTFLIVAVVVPVVITAVALLVLISWLPGLPEQVATHWGVNGADGFGPPSTYVWLLIGVGLVLPLLMAVTTRVGRRPLGRRGPTDGCACGRDGRLRGGHVPRIPRHAARPDRPL